MHFLLIFKLMESVVILAYLVSESHSVVSDSLRPHGLYSGLFQARILEYVAFPFSRGSSQLRD